MSDDFRNDNAVERRDASSNLHLVHLAPTASGLTEASCWCGFGFVGVAMAALDAADEHGVVAS